MRHITIERSDLFEDLPIIIAAENADYARLREKYLTLAQAMTAKGGEAEVFADVAETLRRMEARLFFEQGQKSAENIRALYDELGLTFPENQSGEHEELLREIDKRVLDKHD